MLSSAEGGRGWVAPTASAQFWRAGIDFWVQSASMGPIKTRVFRAHDGNTRRVVYALDGMRARPDLSGWEIETDIAQLLTAHNINVVMPVGGMSSFYSDWQKPSNFGLLGTGSATVADASGSADSGSATGSAGYPQRASWETFLTSELPGALHDRLGFRHDPQRRFRLVHGRQCRAHPRGVPPEPIQFRGLVFRVPESRRRRRCPSASGSRCWTRATTTRTTCGARRGARNGCGTIRSCSRRCSRRRTCRCSSPAATACRDRTNPRRACSIVWNIFTGMGLESLALVNTQAFRVRLMSLGYHNVSVLLPALRCAQLALLGRRRQRHAAGSLQAHRMTPSDRTTTGG